MFMHFCYFDLSQCLHARLLSTAAKIWNSSVELKALLSSSKSNQHRPCPPEKKQFSIDSESWFHHQPMRQYRIRIFKIISFAFFEQKHIFWLPRVRIPIARVQKWLLRPVSPLIEGIFGLKDCLRFSFQAPEEPFLEWRKGHFRKWPFFFTFSWPVASYPGSCEIPGYPGIPGFFQNPDPGILKNLIPGLKILHTAGAWSYHFVGWQENPNLANPWIGKRYLYLARKKYDENFWSACDMASARGGHLDVAD